MTRKLRDQGFDVGLGEFTADAGERNERQKRRLKKTRTANCAFPVAPNILVQDLAATGLEVNASLRQTRIGAGKTKGVADGSTGIILSIQLPPTWIGKKL